MAPVAYKMTVHTNIMVQEVHFLWHNHIVLSTKNGLLPSLANLSPFGKILLLFDYKERRLKMRIVQKNVSSSIDI